MKAWLCNSVVAADLWVYLGLNTAGGQVDLVQQGQPLYSLPLCI